MHIMNVDTNNYSVSSKAKHVRTLKLYNDRVARFITETKDNARINDKNAITYLEASLCKKGKNGKFYVESAVSTFKNIKGLSEKEIKNFKEKASLICRMFKKETTYIDGIRIHTAFWDSTNFIDALMNSIKH